MLVIWWWSLLLDYFYWINQNQYTIWCCIHAVFFSCAALWEMIKFRYQTLSTDHNSILIFLHIFKLIKSYHKGMISENIEIHKILRTLLGLCKRIVSIALKAYSSIIIRNVYKIVHKHPRPPSFRCFVLLWNPVCLSVCLCVRVLWDSVRVVMVMLNFKALFQDVRPPRHSCGH